MRDISKIEVISSEEQLELVKLAQKGDLDARNKLIECNLKFVAATAREYINDRVELFDLIQSGVDGLMYAIKKFDFSHSTCFLTYAVYWIEQYIQKSVRSFGREISVTLLNAHKNDYEDDVQDVISTYTSDEPGMIQQEQSYRTHEHKEMVKKMMAILNPREKEILTMYYGLDNTKKLSMNEISEYMGLSSERTRKIKEGAIHKIRGASVGKYTLDDIY
jgi:RNA polymerase primary sigma factor